MSKLQLVINLALLASVFFLAGTNHQQNKQLRLLHETHKNAVEAIGHNTDGIGHNIDSIRALIDMAKVQRGRLYE